MQSFSAGFLSLIFITLSALHFYWALGGQWGIQNVLPTSVSGDKIFEPLSLMTIVVALGLLAMAMVYLSHGGWLNLSSIQKIVNIGLWVIPIIFIIRAIGDFKYVGFFKSVKQTDFAHWDTILFSPLCLVISVLGFIVIGLMKQSI